MQTHQGSNYAFTGAGLNRLGATEYTLVTIAVDVTGSTQGFEDNLRLALVTAVKSCKKSPRSDNLLVRVITFSTRVGVSELHGFKPLSEIDPDKDYPKFQPDGMTPLYDAVHSAVEAMAIYGAQLTKADFLCNGIVFVITDGVDNHSTATPAMIRDELAKIGRNEAMESVHTVLIGINLQGCRKELEGFQKDAGLNQFIDVGDVTAGKLAKLAAFVSQSVSSQSQALGTGGPSQAIAATI
jgi:hypothetical protein